MYATLKEHFDAEGILHSIFGFKHLGAAHQQSEQAVRDYCSMFQKLVSMLAQQVGSAAEPILVYCFNVETRMSSIQPLLVIKPWLITQHHQFHIPLLL